MKKNILILGSGGREYAMAWKLSNDKNVNKIYCIPGNGGTEKIAHNYIVDTKNHNALLTFVKINNIDLTIVGPENLLDEGIVDSFNEQGYKIFGPTKLASKLESSKLYARDIMKKYNIPHPKYFACQNHKEVISAKEKLGLPIDHFIFCCFNSHQKINPIVFNTWMEILKKTSKSVIWLLKDNKFSEKNLKIYASKKGVDPDRLIFANRVTYEEHLLRLKYADIFLDTYPYNAHTSCSDALRMDVPVITRIGESFASRVAASLLNTLSVPELITTNHDDYEKLAINIYNNLNFLKKLKNKIKKNKINSNLFKTEIFTKNLEKSYIKIYDNYIKGLKPSNIEL